MNIYTNTLLGVAAIIGLIGLSATPAFADSIHGVLENNRVVNETVEAKTIAGKHESGKLAEGGLDIGVLTCKSIPSTRLNYIFHSNTLVDCIFAHPSGEERYLGEMGMGIGIDLQQKSNAQTVFTVIVISSDTRTEAYSLEGTYVGGMASAALGIGAGVSVMFGGGDKNISLQPVAVETSTGLGAALGIGYLTLVPDEES